MESGWENIATLLKNVFIGEKMKQVFAQVDVCFSNSMIEALFRFLKVNFLYFKSFKTLEDLRKSIAFYINEHNTKIPHGVFKFETPKEVFFDLWKKENDFHIEQLQEE